MSIRVVHGHHRGATALVLATWLLCNVPLAHANESGGAGEPDEGWKKVVNYARCAFAVFVATTPVQWAGAMLDCGRQFLDEPPLGAGGW